MYCTRHTTIIKKYTKSTILLIIFWKTFRKFHQIHSEPLHQNSLKTNGKTTNLFLELGVSFFVEEDGVVQLVSALSLGPLLLLGLSSRAAAASTRLLGFLGVFLGLLFRRHGQSITSENWQDLNLATIHHGIEFCFQSPTHLYRYFHFPSC